MSRYDVASPAQRRGSAATREPYDLAAVVHSRSAWPAGMARLVDAAADAEVDAILLTGREALQARKAGLEGWHHGVLLLGIEEGIDLWSLTDPEQDLADPPVRELEEWDRICGRRRVVAVAALGARPTGSGFCRMLLTHALCERPPSGELAADRELVLSALGEGRCYLGRDSLAATRGFRFYADGPGGFLPMGSEGASGHWTLHVRLPLEADIRLLRDGVQVERRHARALDLPVRAPGVYRVHASRAVRGVRRAWVLSNPLYLRAARERPPGLVPV